MKLLFGTIFLVICLLSIMFISQRQIYTKKNNEMNILQVYDPDPEAIFNLYKKGLPIITQSELQEWDGFDMLVGIDYSTIKEIVTENMSDILTIVKGNLQFHNNILSYDWKIDITKIPFDINSPIYVIEQKNLIQLFSTISGEARIILFSPKNKPHFGNFKNNVSDTDIKNEIEKDNTTLDFIEIILREGNMIYIPFGWYYFIYGNHIKLNGDNDENEFNETIILNCINKSLLDITPI